MYPILIEVGGYSISSFGFMLGVAAVVGAYMTSRRFTEAGYDPDHAWTLAMFGFVGCLVGSKLWFVVERMARSEAPVDLEALLSARGGMTFYGGAVGGLLTIWLGTRVTRVPFWSVLNLVPVAGMVAQAVGRVGCFLVGDDYGRATDLPWGIAFPEGHPPTSEPVHPTMLYEAAWLLLGALVLHRRRHRSLAPCAEYFLWTGAGRFAIETLRVNPAFIGPLSNAQVVSLISIVAGAAIWAWAARQSPSPPFTAPAQGGETPGTRPGRAARERARSPGRASRRAKRA